MKQVETVFRDILEWEITREEQGCGHIRIEWEIDRWRDFGAEIEETRREIVRDTMEWKDRKRK